MKRVLDYLRGLIADANLASVDQSPISVDREAIPRERSSLDAPTYLRRGLVIAGLSAEFDSRTRKRGP